MNRIPFLKDAYGLHEIRHLQVNRSIQFLTIMAFLFLIAEKGFAQADTLDQPCSIKVLSVITDVGCFQGDDGAIDLSITGATNPSFKWSSGEISEDIYNKNAGAYSVKIEDDSCLVEKSFTIKSPEEPFSIEISEKENITCFGEQDGQFTIVARGGTSPYVFSIDGGKTFSTADLYSQLADGDYTILAKDALNCETTATVSIAPAEPFMVDLGEPLEIQSGEAITIEGPPGYSEYLWSTGETTPSIIFTKETTEALTEGITLEVKDENGCTGISDLLEIKVLPTQVEEEEIEGSEN